MHSSPVHKHRTSGDENSFSFFFFSGEWKKKHEPRRKTDANDDEGRSAKKAFESFLILKIINVKIKIINNVNIKLLIINNN